MATHSLSLFSFHPRVSKTIGKQLFCESGLEETLMRIQVFTKTGEWTVQESEPTTPCKVNNRIINNIIITRDLSELWEFQGANTLISQLYTNPRSALGITLQPSSPLSMTSLLYLFSITYIYIINK